jgi:hypothetical protein
MDTADLHHEVRALISEADHLSREAYAAHRERYAAIFASVRTSLLRLDRWLGGAESRAGMAGEVDVLYHRVRDAAARAEPEQRARMDHLLASAERMHESASPPKLLVAKFPEWLRIE